MDIVIDENSGFCFGVVKAIQKAESLMTDCNGGVYSLGDIVHNRVEVNRLENLGLKTISHNDFRALCSEHTVLIRAHGEPPATYLRAAELGVAIVDATCPVVSHLQKTVKQAWEKMQTIGGQVVILGKRGHAEVVGLTGQVDGDAIVVENIGDLLQVDFSRPIYLLSQTTQSLDLFEEIKSEIYLRAGTTSVTINDTICRQVSNRNPHLKEFASAFDVVIFVSGRKSSNGKVLFDVCRQANIQSYNIEDQSELRPEWFEGVKSTGICGATSTPRWLMEQIAGYIREQQWGDM